MSMIKSIIASALFAGAVSATTYNIDVGKDGLTYSPNVTTANPGDKVTFTFYSGAHTVNEASFSSPCVPRKDGFYSGFVPTESGPAPKQFVITVGASPMWFYCGQADHCQKGMVGVINQHKSGNKTIDAFASAAARVSKTENPPNGPNGGTFQSSGNNNNNSSAASPVPSPASGTGTPSGQSGNSTTYSTSSPTSSSGSSSASTPSPSTSKTPSEASSLGLKGWVVAAAAVVAGAAVYIV